MLAALSLVLGLGAGADAAVCPPGTGVTLVVQSPDQTVVRCASGPVQSGLEALEQAGFDISFRPGQDGMICVIDQVPKVCNGAPPNAYWSYWAFEDKTWVYRQVGAAAQPEPGSVQGWAFGAGEAPTWRPSDTTTTASANAAAAGGGNGLAAGSAAGTPGTTAGTPTATLASAGVATLALTGAVLLARFRRRHG